VAPSWLAGEPGIVQNWLLTFHAGIAACTADKI